MEALELANVLRKMYGTAPNGEKTSMIHLFGIRYSQELEKVSVKEVVTLSGLVQSYQTEVNKGMHLAKYVDVKETYRLPL